MMLCDWDANCIHPVTFITVSGCLDMHLEARFYCNMHVGDFIGLMRLGIVNCQECPEKLAEYHAQKI